MDYLFLRPASLWASSDFGVFATAVDSRPSPKKSSRPFTASTTRYRSRASRRWTNRSRTPSPISGSSTQLSTFSRRLSLLHRHLRPYVLRGCRRTNEIGIRMALRRSTPERQLRWSSRSSCRNRRHCDWIPLTVAGSRLVANMLYGIHGTDRISLAGAVLLLLLLSPCSQATSSAARLQGRPDGGAPLRMSVARSVQFPVNQQGHQENRFRSNFGHTIDKHYAKYGHG